MSNASNTEPRGLSDRAAEYRQRLTAWRDEPWAFRPLREMGVAYRIAVVFTALASISISSAIAVWYGGYSIESWQAAVVGASVVTFYGLKNLRTNERTDMDAGLAVPFAFAFAGMPAEMLFAMVMLPIASAIKKPITLHLFALNIVNVLCFTSMMFLAHDAIGGDEQPLSPLWFLSVGIAMMVFFTLQASWMYSVLVTGRYTSVRNGLFGQMRENTRTLLITVPMAILLAIALSVGETLGYLTLCIPLLVTLDLFNESDKLRVVSHEATTDALTGLANRRAMLEEFDRIGTQSRASDEELWIVMADLDNFKALNDTRGHDVGDEALVEAARAIRESMRETDFCARYGGEEFIALVGPANRVEATAIAERIRATIETRMLQKFGTTVSVGVARAFPAEAVEDAVARADSAMYRAKKSGKNRVVCSDQLAA